MKWLAHITEGDDKLMKATKNFPKHWLEINHNISGYVSCLLFLAVMKKNTNIAELIKMLPSNSLLNTELNEWPEAR